MPAAQRARLEWFPHAFRKEIVLPLLNSAGLSFELVHSLARPAARLFADLSAAVFDLMNVDPSLQERLEEVGVREARALVADRMTPGFPMAARDFLEAMEWFTEITSAVFEEYRNARAHGADDDSSEWDPDEQLTEDELRGTVGNYVRGALLTMSVLDVLSRDEPLPNAVESWSAVALMELQASANALRAQGLPIPTALRSDTTAPRLPRGLTERIVREFKPQQIWLFGSRAAGVHGPTSDYDLFLVVDDSIDVDELTSWERIAPLRREGVDLSAATRAEFEQSKEVYGTLSRTVAEEGILLYEQDRT